MPVSADQRALLELILERGQDYAAIAELLGVAPEQARARAHRALEDLAGADPDARTAVSDYLLGQLEAGAREEVVSVLRSDKNVLDLASELSAKLRLLVPRADLPDLPGRAAARRRHRRRDPRVLRTAAALLAATTLVVAVAAMTLSDGNGGKTDGDGTSTPPSPSPSAGAAQPRPIKLGPTRAAPRRASGRAAIGQTADRVALQYQATGLAPTRGSQRYVVWLYNTRNAAIALTAGRRVGREGTLSGAAEIAPAVVDVLPQVRFVDISLEPSRKTRESRAYKGESILRGAL